MLSAAAIVKDQHCVFVKGWPDTVFSSGLGLQMLLMGGFSLMITEFGLEICIAAPCVMLLHAGHTVHG